MNNLYGYEDYSTGANDMIKNRTCWIFDLDGTLTLPVHDFALICRELSMPEGTDILQHLATMPREESESMRARLDEIERELARQAEAASGVAELFGMLESLGVRMGILTRNSREIAQMTLETIGFNHYFAVEHIIGRDEVPPKPDPAGITHLLQQWDSEAMHAVMVGDYLFDLQAGKAAGTMTVHVGRPDSLRWPEMSDIMVDDLLQLSKMLE